MTRYVPKILGALAVIGTVAVGTAAPTFAQGVYIEGPGVEFGVGPRWHHHYYYYGHPYHRYWRHRYYRDWD